ncbi:sulfatase-like hydrolase/transferase [Telmatocola sphagniphila]|uniref:Sulfatase-like hydrolase/transferase n=1 Tax=Telmatocola sphagniphila TaxID=1123043 RepID=A0A8E6EUQ8_9BACT|nr:sulfatase-like hydrolase/transferase [Telmatocola sphagniphila]QVL31597.1 sulfatase-like hydrolase/transferase [Telmatocola sphagniphila]
MPKSHLLAALLFGLLLFPSLTRATERPNILLLLTDDQAEWSLGCYGNKESKSPTCDKLAAEGALFKNAFVTTPVCSPSRATFMTGLQSTQCKIGDWITPAQGTNGLGLDPQLPTWPKILHTAGYRTGLVGKWHLGNQAKYHPLANGFDFFAGYLDGGWDPKDPLLEIDGKQTKIDDFSVDRSAADAIRFLDQSAGKPFALCVHFREPHTPYVPMPEADSALFKNLNPTIPDYPNLRVEQVKTWTKQYYACVHAIDRNVAKILAKLDDLKLAENTLVIFTSDHGYNIGHHGIHSKGNGNWCTTDNKGVRPNMWDTSLRIPVIIRWPGVIKPGTVYEEWFSNQDLFPTLLGAAGVEIPRDWQGKGHDLSTLMRGKPYQKREVLFGQYDISNTASQRMRMIRTKDWKLVRHYEVEGQDELFDLKNDPGELRNLYREEQQKAVREQLQMKLIEWMKSIEDPAAK